MTNFSEKIEENYKNSSFRKGGSSFKEEYVPYNYAENLSNIKNYYQ